MDKEGKIGKGDHLESCYHNPGKKNLRFDSSSHCSCGQAIAVACSRPAVKIKVTQDTNIPGDTVCCWLWSFNKKQDRRQMGRGRRTDPSSEILHEVRRRDMIDKVVKDISKGI